MRLTIGKKIAVLLLLMVIIAIVNTFVVYHYHYEHEYDTQIVNVAGRQRMLSQKISKLALSVAHGNDDDRRPLNDTIKLYDTSLKALEFGGETMGKTIIPAPAAMKNLFKNNTHIWKRFKEYAEAVARSKRDNPLFSRAIDYIQAQNEELLQFSDNVTNTFDLVFSKKIIRIRTVLFLMLGIDIVLLLIGSYVAHVNIARPIRNLSEFAMNIGKGDFTQKIAIPNSRDEVGDLAHSFAGMIRDLQKTTVSKDYVDNIIRSMIDTLIVVDQDAKIKTANKATCDLLGYVENELIGQPVEKIIAEKAVLRKGLFKAATFQKLFEEGTIANYEIKYKTKSGGVIPMLFSGAVMRNKKGELIGIVGIAKDISERKKAEKALAARQREIEELNATLEKRVQEELKKSRQKDLIMMHQSRLAAMGEMIGHIAHQWKQPLNALNILLYNIKDSLEDKQIKESVIYDLFEKGENLIMKMSTTVDDFKNFFKPNKEKKEFSINKIIRDSLSLIDDSFRYYSISVIMNEKDEITSVGYSNEYSQVILNILGNAKDAIAAGGSKGEIKIDVLNENGFAVVKIKDTGGGIPKNILDKIFEPYFTTKGEKKGTGIGLYLSRVIISEHMNGSIDVHNTKSGAEFKIITPISRRL